MSPQQWPAARDFQEAIQNPSHSFLDAELRGLTPALDRLGMPIVTSGQFAYVFKLNDATGSGAQAVRCFRGFLGDRQQRYQAIDEHLDRTSIPSVASFDYDPEGIIVLGSKYPILVMEWISGLPLDVHIGDVFQRTDVLKYLAESWLKIVESLNVAGVSHGDLQHGNIIVQNDELRLVDLDGMFVPKMAGWRASELGHQHYQNPRRSTQHFGVGLDNFSSLVIYVSFLAIAESPELWRDFHDENLIFTKADFRDPTSSPLFGKLKKLNGVQKFTEVLADACVRDPLKCPYLLDLVAPPSKLPGWMRKAPVVQTKTLTREAQAKSGVPPPVPAQFRREVTGRVSTGPAPWWQQSSVATPAPAAPQTGAFIPPTVTRPAIPPDFFSRAVLGEALNYSVAWLVWIWIWFPTLFALFSGMGAAAQQAGIMTAVSYLLCCNVVAYKRSCQAIYQPPTTPPLIPVVNVPPTSSTPRTKYSPRAVPSGGPTPSTAIGFVGNRVSQVYHVPSCGWANKIRARNRVYFASSSQASSRGFRPCGICKP
jgi:hypothetical protein